MKMSQVFKSNYFNAEALVDGDLLLTIQDCQLVEFEAREGKPAEQKMVISFEEDERQLALNMTNWIAIAEIIGDDETDNWPGNQVVLHRKKDKGIGGAQVWCVRIKDPRILAQPQPRRAAPVTAAPQQQQRTANVPQQRAAAVNRAVAGRGQAPPPPVDNGAPLTDDDIPF